MYLYALVYTYKELIIIIKYNMCIYMCVTCDCVYVCLCIYMLLYIHMHSYIHLTCSHTNANTDTYEYINVCNICVYISHLLMPLYILVLNIVKVFFIVYQNIHRLQ